MKGSNLHHGIWKICPLACRPGLEALGRLDGEIDTYHGLQKANVHVHLLDRATCQGYANESDLKNEQFHYICINIHTQFIASFSPKRISLRSAWSFS